MKKFGFLISVLITGAACGGADDTATEQVDPKDECVFCDEKADAFGIARESYLAYGIVNLANTASLQELDDEVPLDVRAAKGIVAKRPFEYIEQVDTVSYVGKTAFANLARYAQANGYVPSCGDGDLQPILEACDDGNLIDGDGCSASCTVDQGQTNDWFSEQPELIKGSEIGVDLVNQNGYYLRERPFTYSTTYTDAVEAIFERADGINANAPDDVVSWDELAILSKEPFYSTLFANEKAALADAWAIYEISTDDPVVIEYQGGGIKSDVPFNVSIERPGPLKVIPVRDIDSLSSDTKMEVARRLQQVAGLNADGDANTVELADLEAGIEDLAPVFTSYEVNAMQGIIDQMFKEATPSSGGDFAINFASLPNQGSKSHSLVAFDGWEFGFQTNIEVHHDAYNSDYDYDSFDGNLRTEFSFTTWLRRNGRSKWTCSVYSSCDNPFRYTGVRFIHLDGTSARAGRERSVMLMEEWENGERKYNRVVEFKNTYSHVSRRATYLNQYMAARPAIEGGSPLSLRSNGTKKYTRGGSTYTYDRFKLATVQTEFNKNLQKFFPHVWSMFTNRLKPGRYTEFEGVVLDIHESRAAIAYFDGCELPMEYERSVMQTEACPATGRKVKITFNNIAATLKVYAANSLQGEIDIYNSNDIWNGYEDRLLDLDRTYYTF